MPLVTETYQQQVRYTTNNTTVTFDVQKDGYKPIAVQSLVPGIGFGALLNFALTDTELVFMWRNVEGSTTLERTASCTILYQKI